MAGDSVLLFRWSRQDRLAVIVIILAVSFLTGTALVISATAAQTQSIAEEFDPGGTVTTGASTEEQPGMDLRILRVGSEDETQVLLGGPLYHRLVRVPDSNTRLVPYPTSDVRTVRYPDRTLSERLQLSGSKASRSYRVTAVTSTPIFPPWWLRSNYSVPETLGDPAWVTLRIGNTTTVPDDGVPLRGALSFFVSGTQQIHALLSLTALGAAVLIAVTLYSVTRTTVRRRRHTIGVLRTTGATRGRVGSLVVLRVLGLTAVGTAMGYAVGVIGPNLMVNIAIWADVPVTLSARVTPTVVGLLLPMYGLVLLVAILAASTAVWPTLQTPPARLMGRTETDAHPESSSTRPASWLRPTILDPRTLLPATAILTAVIVFVLVLVAVGGAIAPLTATQDTTITQPGATHPIASSVPEGYADALRSAGVPASAELLVFAVTDGEPFLTRAADFDAFANVRSIQLETGRTPETRDEGVIGADLAETLDIEVGDTMLLGGSTTPAATQVAIVGVFSAPGLVDDQLVVPLATGAHLTGRPPGSVHYIRTEGRPPLGTGSTGPVVLDVDTPGQAVAGEPISVRVTVANPTEEQRSKTVTAKLGDQTERRSVTVTPFGQRTVGIEFTPVSVGDLELQVANQTRTLTVVDPESLQLSLLPSRVPVGSEPLLRVTEADGTPVEQATVEIGNRTYETDLDGRVRVTFPKAGETTVTVTAGDRTLERTISVRENATRDLAAALEVSPNQPTVVSPLSAEVTLFNPWSEPVTDRIRLEAAGETRTITQTVEPGVTRTRTFQFGRFPAGEVPVSLAVGAETVAEQTVTVSGDERLASALATQGRTGAGSTLGQAAEALLGNVWLVAAILLALATAMGVGSSTAVFARAVAARRHTIGVHRATGASPRRVLGMILADTLRLGIPATILALGMAVVAVELLSALDYLVAFGIRLDPAANPVLLLGIGGGALGLLLVGAAIATLRLVRQSPARLLGRSETGFEHTTDSQQSRSEMAED